MKFSVLVPTFQRPDMLRDALKSIAHQSALDSIAEVIVSENSADDSSSSVCNEFPSLPIRYVLQNDPVPVLKHFSTLVDYAVCDHIAWIADDDMWGRQHLSNAARALETTNAIASFASTVCVSDSYRRTNGGQGPILNSFSPNCEYRDLQVWTTKDFLVESLCKVPQNTWSMVAQREILQKALQATSNVTAPWDADRIQLACLSTFGDVVVNSEVSLFYRTHTSMVTHDLAKNRLNRSVEKNNTLKIVEYAKQHDIDIVTECMKLLDRLSVFDRQSYLHYSLRGALDVLPFRGERSQRLMIRRKIRNQVRNMIQKIVGYT